MGRLAGYGYRAVDPASAGAGPCRLCGAAGHQAIRRLRALGFESDRQACGSHQIWWCPVTRRRTTAPSHPGDLAEGTLAAILRQAGVEPQDFLSA